MNNGVHTGSEALNLDIEENDFYTLIGLSEEEILQINNTYNSKDKDISDTDTESIKSEPKSKKNVVEENDISNKQLFETKTKKRKRRSFYTSSYYR